MAESRRSARRFRCAIYTRKSSEEGLEQAFNSLDAQREACAAFILSQKHEGWTVSPTLYDDGGFSGMRGCETNDSHGDDDRCSRTSRSARCR
jgi:hypothetical protein